VSVLTAPEPGGLVGDVAPAVRSRVSWKAPITYAVMGLASLLAFGVFTSGSAESTFVISTPSDAWQIAPVTVPSRLTAVVLSLVALGLAAFVAVRTRARRRVGVWVPVVFGLCIVLSFLTWADAGKVAPITLTSLLVGGLVLSIPLVFGSLAGLLCERSGIINIAIEGQLLAGAFLAAVVASMTSNAYAGLVAAPVAGALVSVLLAFFSIRYRVNQIIVGVVLNGLVIGLTGFLFSAVLSDNIPLLNSPPRLPVLPIPLLSEIPVVGPVLFRQSALVYLMFVIVVLLQVMLFRSRWGLRMRSVGEHPKAADTVGIDVNRTRWRNTVLGGAVAGLGGAAFTVALGLAFTKEMTGGKGYIALAAMILGRWNPRGALVAALLFGFADALGTNLSLVGTPVPPQLLAMLPYVATIFAVAGLVGRVRAPAAEGIPYGK
jgi:simple sugar transport system permease protein